jgi:hypothetical protein
MVTMSMPALPAAASPALELLESKKKGQRSGLYQWVLWREALKGEKDRRASSLSSLPSPGPASAASPRDKSASWRRLSFS